MDILGTLATTTTLTPGSSLNSEIDFSGDIDVIRTSLTNGLHYGFRLSTSDPNLDLFLELLDSSGTRLDSSSGNNGETQRIGFEAVSSSDYYLRVTSSTGDETGPYQLSINANDTVGGTISTTTNAILGGQTFSSALDVRGDVDVFSVQLTQGITYGFDLSTTSQNLDLFLELLSAGAVRLDSDSETNGNTAQVNFVATGTATYYLRVSDSSADESGVYSLKFDADDTIAEITDANALVVAPGTELNSEIDRRSDRDVVQSNLVQGLSYGFELSTDDQNLDLFLELLNNLAVRVDSDSETDGNTAKFTYSADYTGVYYSRISDSSEDETGAYTFKINNNDTILNSIASTTVLDPGESVVSAIDVRGDVDVVKTDLLAGITYRFTMTGSNNLDMFLELLDVSGTRLDSDSETDGNPASFTYTAAADGTFYLRMSDSSHDETGGYEVAINNDDTLVDTIATTDVILPGQTLNSKIDHRNDVDVVKVNLVGGITYGFRLTPGDENLDVFLELLDASGTRLDSDSESDGDWAYLSYTPTADGTFHLRVSDSSQDETGTYALLVDNSDDIKNNAASTRTIQPGTCIVSAIDQQSDTDRINMTLQAGATYTFDLSTTSNNLDLDLSLFDENGYLDNASENNGDTASFSFTATATKQYYVEVSSSSGETGNYMLLLTNDADDDLTGSGELHGGKGRDRITGLATDDNLTGGDGDDTIFGGSGADTIGGGSGDDRVYDGSGNDIVNLGDGDDYVRVGGGTDSFFGGSGTDDYISYYDSSGGIRINLAANTISGSWGNNDVISGFESVGGSRTGGDTMYGTSGANRLKGYGGDDKFYAGSGNDKVYGGSGDDYMRVGGGVESFYGGSGTDDYISYYDSSGGITIDLAANTITGSWGNNDVISGFESAGGSGTGADKMYGTSGANRLKSYGGNDSLWGRSGDDKLYGGSGNDRFDGGHGNDTLYGGSGDDIFHFDRGEDDDVIKDFENNDDTIQFDNFGYLTDAQSALDMATETGGDVFFNFGTDGTLLVENTTKAALLNDIQIV